MNAVFTARDVAREAIRLANENPDAVYESPSEGGCFYAQGEAAGAQGCLLGQALRNLGAEDLERFDRSNGWMDVGIHGVLRELGIPASYRDAEPLVAAQSRQDGGRPWSEAVEPLIEMMEEAAK